MTTKTALQTLTQSNTAKKQDALPNNGRLLFQSTKPVA